jgi:hypothetical protein
MADALQTVIFNGSFGPNTTGGAGNITCDASDDGLGWAFQADSADPITHLGFRYGARTGTPPTYSIRLEGLDASGLPDGTDVGGGSPTAVTFTPPADTSINGLWQWKTLTNAYTPTRGQFLCETIRYSSGTIDGSNNSSFTNYYTNRTPLRNFPYALTLASGSWSKVSTGANFGYRTASGRYGYITQSHSATTTANTAGHVAGGYFTLPSGWGDTFKLLGIEISGRFGATAGSCKISLYNTSGTTLQSVTVDADHIAAAAGTAAPARFYFADTTLATLSFGTKYYVGVEVVSGTCGVNGYVLAEAADASSFGNGTNRGLVTYNGSSWTETDTTIPLIELILADITEPAGGSGGVMNNPLMTGGMQRT